MQIDTQRELKKQQAIIGRAIAGKEKALETMQILKNSDYADAEFYAKKESDIAEYDGIIRRAEERIKEIQMNTYLAAHSLDAEITIQQITDNEASFFEAAN